MAQTNFGLKNESQAHFIDRVKTDPKFAGEAFRLQDAIKVAWEPGTDVQTYFNQNPDLTLDTREAGCSETFGEKELQDLQDDEDAGGGGGVSFKQQESEDAKHPRANQIIVISQGLAFSNATVKDVERVTALVNETYNKAERVEANWGEGFRTGDAVDTETIAMMIRDPDVFVLLCEAPDGRKILKDGTLLGVCCYSIGAAAVTAGQASPVKGAVRILAVRQDFHGLCVGQRILNKVEAKMLDKDSTAVCMCVVSSRKTMCKWSERRGYAVTASLKFPVDSVPFDIVDSVRDDLQLLVYEKKLATRKERNFRKQLALEKLSVTPVVHTVIVDDGIAQDKELNVFEEAEAALRGLAFKAGDEEQRRKEAAKEQAAVERVFKDKNAALKA